MTSCHLNLSDVAYRYGRGPAAVQGVTLDLSPGILGLLGPNGAGKSTLMRMLATLARPTAGSIRWNGEDIVRAPDALRRTLGYLPQDFGVYPALTAREFLTFLAAVKGLTGRAAGDRVAEVLAMVGLADAADRRLGGFSGGMRQRVGIAQALLNDPRVLIVDEPTVGLDPEERMRFRHLLTDLAGERLIILSTHIVSDVEASASQIAILVGGTLRYFGSPEGLVANADGRVWEWTVDPASLPEVRARHALSAALRRPDGVRVRAVAANAPATSAAPVAPELEDAYAWCLAPAGGP